MKHNRVHGFYCSLETKHFGVCARNEACEPRLQYLPSTGALTFCASSTQVLTTLIFDPDGLVMLEVQGRQDPKPAVVIGFKI